MTINGTTLGQWTLSWGELRSIARAFHAELTSAAGAEAALPSDEYLDAQLRERGCPETQLSHWRDHCIGPHLPRRCPSPRR
jgi:hypothetical protein